MSNTYNEIQIQSNRAFLMDLYDVICDFTRIATSIPPPFSFLALFIEVAHFVKLQVDGTFDLIYPGSSVSGRFFRYMTCNITEVKERIEAAQSQNTDASTGNVVSWWKHGGMESHLQRKITAFMQNIRYEYLEKIRKEDELLTKAGPTTARVNQLTWEHVKATEKQLKAVTKTQALILDKLGHLNSSVSLVPYGPRSSVS
eukprot:CAMPEP_0184290266 /NCGR_PEP_ID=MMETSP1049-20130417/2587_1 /TAXON_ID=77928 /ORGANISM="Proteomonas sulcata, Strain CCMP704" /LENGTH=199 /DNA_ID=CAMNT_0026597393 /DNA_START=8 /DNA_END=607 /DNA_ORIENTATION=-